MSVARRRRVRRDLRLRDRFFQPGVARAITSPLGIVAGSSVGAALIAAGAHPLLCIGAAIGGWAVPVVRAMQRVPGLGKARGEVRLASLPDRWASAVADAEDAAARYQEAIKRARSGPLRDRLVELEGDVLQSLDACYELARAGGDAEAARQSLDPSAMMRASKRGSRAARKVADSHRRLIAELLDVESKAGLRMTLINGRLDEAVGRATEIITSAVTSAPSGEDRIDDQEVAGRLAAELGRLSEALHEVDQHDHPHTTRPGATGGITATG